REMEICRSGNSELYRAGSGFELPVAVGARIPLHRNASRKSMRIDVTCRALNLDFAATGIRLDAPSRFVNVNDARKSVRMHIAFDVRNIHISRYGRNAYVVANISG